MSEENTSAASEAPAPSSLATADNSEAATTTKVAPRKRAVRTTATPRATTAAPRATKARSTKAVSEASDETGTATESGETAPRATANGDATSSEPVSDAAPAPKTRATATRKPRVTKKAAESATSTLDAASSTAANAGESIFSDRASGANDGAPQTGQGAPDANVQAPLPLDAPPQVLPTVRDTTRTRNKAAQESTFSQESASPREEQAAPTARTESVETVPSVSTSGESPAEFQATAVPQNVTDPNTAAYGDSGIQGASNANGDGSAAPASGEGETRSGETDNRDFNRSGDGRLLGGRFRGREVRQGRTFRGRGNGVENGDYRDNSAGDNRAPENRGAENRGAENRPNDHRGESRNDSREHGDNRQNDNRQTDNRQDNRQFQNGQGRRGRFGQYDRDNQRDNQGRNNQGRDEQNREPQPPRRAELDWATLEEKNALELREIAGELGVANTVGLKSHDLMMKILEAQAELAGNLIKNGIIEMQNDGKGFLRCSGYLQNDGDVYVSQSQIKRFNLKTGDMVTGLVRAPKEMERYHGLLRVEAINGESTEAMKTRKEFEKLTPIFPDDKFKLEIDQTNITARIIDLVSPIGKGQRGLIVAPPKAGKTTLLKSIANSISLNHPEVTLIVLLIDERPEEVTDISRSVRGEVVASTFDEMPENHMRVAELVFEKAKRLVEQHKDVVILLDSITRLSRASNLVVTPSGRTLSGGLDPAAMYRPKRMFGAARNIEEGGSLTILATTLVETGSRMDEMIFEEFKGTGNMDLVLDRDLFNQRIFPAIDINKSGTRRDDLLMSKEDLAATFHLRRTLAALDNDKAITLLIDRLKNTKTNSDFMAVVQRSQRNSANPSVSGG